MFSMGPRLLKRRDAGFGVVERCSVITESACMMS